MHGGGLWGPYSHSCVLARKAGLAAIGLFPGYARSHKGEWDRLILQWATACAQSTSSTPSSRAIILAATNSRSDSRLR